MENLSVGETIEGIISIAEKVVREGTQSHRIVKEALALFNECEDLDRLGVLTRHYSVAGYIKDAVDNMKHFDREDLDTDMIVLMEYRELLNCDEAEGLRPDTLLALLNLYNGD